MPGILHAIRDSSIQELDIQGFRWRIRKVCSADLARVGFAWLSMASPDAAADAPTPDLKAALGRADEGKLVQLAALKDAIIAAGLLAIGHDDQWEECTVTLKQSEEDADKGILWVGSLPADADNELFTAIMSLSTDGGSAADRLASFRGQPRNADTAGHSGEAIRGSASSGA